MKTQKQTPAKTYGDLNSVSLEDKSFIKRIFQEVDRYKFWNKSKVIYTKEFIWEENCEIDICFRVSDRSAIKRFSSNSTIFIF